MSWTLVVRVARAAGAGLGAAVAVAIVYAIVDLYLSGHSVPVPVVWGRPLHRFVAEILLFVAPLAAAVVVFWSDRGP